MEREYMVYEDKGIFIVCDKGTFIQSLDCIIFNGRNIQYIVNTKYKKCKNKKMKDSWCLHLGEVNKWRNKCAVWIESIEDGTEWLGDW